MLGLALPVSCLAHVSLNLPTPRNGLAGVSAAGQCTGGECFWFSQGCQPGCANCTDGFKNDGNCDTEMEPTLPAKAKYRTYKDIHGYDWTKHNPWRSPGHAPIFSPCGLAGGGLTNHPENGATARQTGYSQGFDALGLPSAPVVEWAQGSEQEVGWSITANHGGGLCRLRRVLSSPPPPSPAQPHPTPHPFLTPYSPPYSHTLPGGYAYRLCAKSASRVDEACFQAGHLEFVGTESWIAREGGTKRTAISATRVSTGTHPAASTWTKNPIPACDMGDGSGGVGGGFNCSGAPPQFEPPLPGLYGYGSAECFATLGGNCTRAQEVAVLELFHFMIVDKVRVPAELPAGDYLLSFRYDAEQTPQVWANCADVTVTSQTPRLPASSASVEAL